MPPELDDPEIDAAVGCPDNGRSAEDADENPFPKNDALVGCTDARWLSEPRVLVLVPVPVLVLKTCWFDLLVRELEGPAVCASNEVTRAEGAELGSVERDPIEYVGLDA